MKISVGTLLVTLLVAQNVFAGPGRVLTREADCKGVATLEDHTPGSPAVTKKANITLNMRDSQVFVTMDEPTIQDIRFEFLRSKNSMGVNLSMDGIIGHGTFGYANQTAMIDVIVGTLSGTAWKTAVKIRAYDLTCTNIVRR